MNELMDKVETTDGNNKNISEVETTAAKDKNSNTDKTTAEKKAEHEAAESKRKAEWEEKQAKKKEKMNQILAEINSMSDDELMNASIKKTGDDIERLTRRNMKLCVNEHIQTLCLENPEFARKTMHPAKSLINCFKYINSKAQEYLKEEMKMTGEKPESGGVGGDVPDDLCYKWAEDYFNDLDAEIDKDKDDKFEPKTFYGGGSSAKSNKKEPAKPKEQSGSKEQVGLFEQEEDVNEDE